MPEPADMQPRVTVILPARNEEANIHQAVRSLAAQTLPVEIVAVDDDSSDRTGEILDELAREFPGVKVLHNRDLPDGWTGKNHACWLGAQRATSDWLLFTDADVRHSPQAVEAGLALASEHGAELVSFSPHQVMRTWWERAVITIIYLRLAALYPYWKVNDPGRPDAAANGQWLLISRRVYENIGGHSAVRQEIVEDVALARLVKLAGNRIRFSPAGDLAQARMYRSFSGMWEGWSKNLFLLHSPWRMGAFLTIIIPVLFWMAVLMGWGQIAAGAMAGLIAGHFTVGGYFTWRKFSPVNVLLLFPGLHLLSALMLSSWIHHRWFWKVTWKGRSYAVGAGGSVNTTQTK